MKQKSFILYIVCVALLLASCGHERYPATLTMADSLTMANPDSARTLLAAMAADTASMTESQRMYYKLLTLKADGKAYIKQTSDKTAVEILNYYEHGGDQRLLPQVYFYVACTYRDLNDSPQAMDYYQKVLDVMPKDGDLWLRSYANNQIGGLFQQQRLYVKAHEYFYHSFQIDSLRKDTLDMITALIDMSQAYENTDVDKSLLYLHSARRLNDKANIGVSYMIDERLSVLFSDKGNFDSACFYIQGPLKHIAMNDSSAIYSIARNAYMGSGNLDSAKYYSLELMRMGTVYAKKNASKVLSQIYFKEKNPALGFKYIEYYKQYADSVEELDAKQALVSANSLYNYKIREKEIAKMKLERNTQIIIFLIVMVISAILISSLIIYNLINKRKQQILRLRIGLLNKLEKEHIEQNKREINVKQQKIDFLEQELCSAQKSRTDLEKELEEQKAKLALAIESNKKNIVMQDEQRQKLLNSTAYSIVRGKLAESKPIKPSEWKEIMVNLDTMLSDFKLLLYQAHDLSDQEYKVSLLVKMGFKNVEIGILIGRGENSVSQMRKRLYKKLTGKDGTAYDFDELIKSL